MFGFLKRKERDIASPVDGQIVALESVEDEVFSQKLVGDGVAVLPVSNIFSAPIKGTISKIFSTNHAYSIKSDKDLEVMVHIGLDTVALEGEGFVRLLEEGTKVEVGDAIIKADLTYIKEQSKDIITPIVILESSDVNEVKKLFDIVKSSDIIMKVS